MTMNVLAAVLRHIRKSSLQPVHTRQASTSSNPYPYPLKANPSPNEIFHLPHGASRNDVKTRCMYVCTESSSIGSFDTRSTKITDYDLVRIYHPDSPASRSVPSETAHARFQAISSAYAVLSGKPRAARHPGNDTPSFTKRSYNDINAAMRKARHRRRAELDLGFDDRWKDRMMLGAVLLVRSCCNHILSLLRSDTGLRLGCGRVLLSDIFRSPTSYVGGGRTLPPTTPRGPHFDRQDLPAKFVPGR